MGRSGTILRLLVWAALAAPLVWITYDYVFGETYYGGFIHLTGRFAAWFLIAALAVTPLRLTFPASSLTRWLIQQRRYLGVAAFSYATAHMIAYLARMDWERIAEDAGEAGIWTGWAALFVFALLAVTSNDWSVRQLRRLWKSLHRLVYVAAILTFAHWVLTAFDPFLAWCHIAALCLLETYRLVMTYRRRAFG